MFVLGSVQTLKRMPTRRENADLASISAPRSSRKSNRLELDAFVIAHRGSGSLGRVNTTPERISSGSVAR